LVAPPLCLGLYEHRESCRRLDPEVWRDRPPYPSTGSLGGELVPGQVAEIDATSYSSKILSTLIFSFLGTSTVYIFGTLLTANGNLKELILISAIAVLLNVVLNLVFIPREAAYGAAVAAAATNLLIGALNFGLSVKIFGFKINYRFISRLLIFSLLVTLLFYTGEWWQLNWMLAVLLLGTCSLGLAFLLGLIEWTKITTLLREKGE